MIYLFLTSLIYIVMISIVYFSKKTKNNKQYSTLLLTSIIGVIINIIQYYTLKLLMPDTIIKIVGKIFLVYVVTWMYFFFTYIEQNIISNKLIKKISDIKLIILKLSILSIVLLPIKYYYDGFNMHTKGISQLFTYIITLIEILIIIISCIVSMKSLKTSKSKYLMFILLSIIISATTIFQYFNPKILLISPSQSFILILAFFLIEKPDSQIIDKLTKEKEKEERTNRAKNKILKNRLNEIEKPISLATTTSYEKEKAIQDANTIMKASETLLQMAGEKQLDLKTIKISEEKYNVQEEITKIYNAIKNQINEELSLELTISSDIPYKIIGDKSKFNEILYNLLNYVIRNTKKGKINLNITCVNNLKEKETNIIIECKSKGNKINVKEVNRLLSEHKININQNTTIISDGMIIALTKKLIDILKGKIEISTNEEKENIIKVTIPEKIYKMNKPIIEKIEILDFIFNKQNSSDQIETLDQSVQIMDNQEEII